MQPRVEDVVFCFLRFPSGLAAHLHLSWLDPHKERRFTVVGSQRMATFDDMELERKVTVYDKGFDEDAGATASTSPARATSGARAIGEPRAAAARVRALRRAASATATRRARTARRACASCACWRRLQASLDASRRDQDAAV